MDKDKCVRFRVGNLNGNCCNECLKACPYNKPSTLFHLLGNYMVKHSPLAPYLFGNVGGVGLEDWLEYDYGTTQNKGRRDGEVSPGKMEIKDLKALTAYIKDQARALGADVVGVCELPQTHVFTADHQGKPISLRHEYAIVVGTDLPYNLALPTAPLPWSDYYSTLPEELAAMLADKMPRSGAVISEEELEKLRNTMRFFSEGGRTAVELARLIRSQGYPARAHYSRWSEVQIIPLAEEAGLGELGRTGLLLTKEYGPRGSFAVITTDLPLKVDPPVRLRLSEFCEDCAKCSVACIGPCPFNKPDYLLHRVATYMGTRGNVVTNRLLVLVDDLLGYGDMAPYMAQVPSAPATSAVPPAPEAKP